MKHNLPNYVKAIFFPYQDGKSDEIRDVTAARWRACHNPLGTRQAAAGAGAIHPLAN